MQSFRLQRRSLCSLFPAPFLIEMKLLLTEPPGDVHRANNERVFASCRSQSLLDPSWGRRFRGQSSSGAPVGAFGHATCFWRMVRAIRARFTTAGVTATINSSASMVRLGAALAVIARAGAGSCEGFFLTQLRYEATQTF